MPVYTVEDLSRGFFQTVFDGSYNTEVIPVLQVLEVRPISKNDESGAADQRFRFRLSDGVFFYSSCLNQSQIADKIHEFNICHGTPIIRIDRYNFGNLNPVSGNRPMIIIDFTLLYADAPVLGKPVPHTGNANDYRGLNPATIAQNANRVAVKDENAGASATGFGGQPNRDHNIGNANRNRMGLIGQNVTPIKLITPYVNKWRICGLVTAKEDMREIKTAQRGDMKVFNFELTDEGSCIRIAAFNEVAEKFYAVVQKDSMYYISDATVKQVNRRFNNTGHDYEISLKNTSEVVPCTDRAKISQPKLSLNVVQLSHVASRVNEWIDVLAIVDKVNDIQQVTQRSTGEPLDKRDLELIDQTGVMVVLTAWGEQARLYDVNYEHQTIGVKGASVREFNGGYSLSIAKSSRVEFNLDCDESNQLYTWYKEKRPHIKVNSVSRSGGGDGYSRDLRVIGVADELSLGKDEEKGVYFHVTGFISALKTDGALYKSCGTNGCKKKVIDIDNQYRCEKCNLTLSTFKYVLLLSVEITDFSGSHWATMFEEQATKLLQKSAEELGNLLDTNQLEEYNDVFSAVRFRQYNFRIRAKTEFFNESERIKWTVYSIDSVNYDKYIGELRKAVDALEAA